MLRKKKFFMLRKKKFLLSNFVKNENKITVNKPTFICLICRFIYINKKSFLNHTQRFYHKKKIKKDCIM